MHESESEVTQLCPILSNTMDYSPLGSSVRGIFQARVLEWVAIAFSISQLRAHVWFYLGTKIPQAAQCGQTKTQPLEALNHFLMEHHCFERYFRELVT